MSPAGEPMKAGVALLDVVTGLYATVGILAALQERERTGHGRHVSVALFDASVAAMVNQAANYLIGGVVPGRLGSQHPNIVPYQLFHASDRPFILAAGNDRLFARTCEVLDRPEWALDERFATNEARVVHRAELIPLMEAAFAQRPVADLLGMLEAAAVPCAPIRGMDEVFASPEGAAMVETVQDPGRAESVAAGLRPHPLRRHAPAHPVRAAAVGRAHGRGAGRVSTALERWRRALEARAIPDTILAAAPESPWGFPAEAFRRRAEAASDAAPTPTTSCALEALPDGGTVLDVGVGGGRDLAAARRPRVAHHGRRRAGGHARSLRGRGSACRGPAADRPGPLARRRGARTAGRRRR